ncbi:non-ribosomal peptide synthetase [Amycolatopsis sp. WQ 127309]|uniref:non-ribosomal peptide synthetase n=1 Tax=Amycolatopsis sp. WQ 127309 TaxID=2932773 RepID=UPI001FF40BC4|nr:non-ribosomal peptide synthetase [Amycolatopsis sp. WQ 127309]UOZ02729.1 amino acid adenylation domain-containing protein [Amycolatopsis sp. WQ 127309]
MSGAPLSFSQQRLWFLDQLEPGSAEYVVPFAWRLTGELVIPALEDAITRVVSRHEVLRARFVAEDGEPAQVVTAAEPARLPLLDARDDDLAKVVAGFAAEPFDLARGPLWRAGLVRAGERDHVFVFAAHHIVMDAWSARNLVDELGECYRAAPAGRPPVLPELTMQYADFARWQRERLDGAVASRLLGHWRRQLDGIRPLDLPTDRPRGALASAEGTAVEFTVPPDVADGLVKLAGEHRVTRFMIVLAAVQVVLGRYCGQDDVAVGTPIASRGREEAEALIGFFVNTLVLRTDLSGDPTFAELLARVREVALDAYDHEELPFERLVEELHPDRDRTSTPLIQALLVLNTTFDHLELDGLRAEAFPVEFLHSKFDLTVGFADSPDSLTGWVRYRTELFDTARMTRMCGHLLQVLTAVAVDPEVRLSDLPLLTDAERGELVPAGAPVSGPAEPAHALFEAHAKTSPDVVALVEPDGGRLTYGELDVRANRLARHLLAAGASARAPIGICLPRSADAIVGILAALKTGIGYVALDPGYPPARLEYLLTDSGIDLVLADRDTAAALPPGFAGRTVDPRDPAIAGRPGHDLALPVHPLSVAYIAYTSGSTGQPKGVVATHEAVSLRIRHIRADYELGPADVVLAIAGFGFDASAREILGTLTSGARLVLAGPDAAKDPAGVVGLVAAARVTVLASTVPSVLYELAAQPAAAGVPADVRLVLCSGERLHAERLAGCAWLAGKVLNQFGPTETTITVTWTRVPAGAGPSWRYDVGSAVGDTTLYVLDDALNPCPVGVPGELYIGGPGLARGYLARPGLTAERFVPDPFGGGRLYRTGDRCRWSPAHTLEHLGRLDNQLKVRGLRVEPAEIEAALRALEPVTDAVVVLREDVPGDQRLTAYFTTSGAPPAASWLHAELERVLPASLVPSVFVALPALPRTVNGKTDRGALPAPGSERPELGAAPVRPRTPAEAAVAGVWREVLGLDEVGVLDDFFALGGHSLLATHVVARLRSRYGFAVSLRALFETRTVAKLAALVAAVDPVATGDSAEVPITRSGRRGPAPLSFAQHRLWFLDQLEPGGTDYVIPLGWELSGVVDAGALRAALTEVAHRHHTLRTTFPTDGGEPVQVVAPPGPVPFTVLEAEDGDLDGVLAGFVAEPFDLGTGPVWRALLVRTGPRRSVFALTIHHIVADAWSAAVFADEIGRAYRAAVEGHAPAPADLPIQYTDFARWERDRLSGPALDEPLAYWRDRLTGTEVLDLPADRPRPAATETAGASLEFTLPAETAVGLRALARAEGATLFMVVLAGLQAVLARYTGQVDITVGTPVARRARPETEPLIGMFVNTLVLRTDVGGDPAFTALLGRVRDTTLGAYEHQDVPFERLVEELRPDRDLTRTPLFQVSLSVDNTPALRLRLPGLTLADHPLTTDRAKYDLALAFTDNAEEFSGVISYRTALFDARRIERLGEHLRTFFAGVVADPGARLSAIPLLTEAERRTVVEEWGTGPAERPEAAERPGWIHRVLSKHAQERPDAVAVRAADGATLSFRELVDRAERLAGHLRDRGAGPEDVVGICLTRRPETIVALLAVRRAGAAYLPLDPGHPAERLAATLADARAAILLTDTAHATDLGARVRADVVDVDDPATARAIAGHAPAGDPGGHPESLAYVIYTSGSTGTPKGVQVTHRGLANYLAWAAGAYPFPRAGGAVLHSSPAFDMTVTSIFLPLLAGRPVQLAEEGADPAGLLPAPGAALVKLTPTHLKVLAGTSPAGVVFPPAVIVGGEDLPAAAATQVLAGLPPGGYLVNEYGPTETVVGCCVHTLPAGAVAGPGSVPIGRPIAGTRVHVLDAAMSPCPIGVAGELYIGGAGVARGYRDRPGPTAERFVPDPFGSGRLYRTGDSCRWSPDGHLEYLGRTDFQVKIRGHRVEPGEIEATLLAQPGVAEAVVVAREDTPDDRRLVAYLVPGADPLDLPALRARLTSSLPGYLVPSAFVVLPALPLSGSGKVDRRALPAPDTARPDLGRGPVPPRGLLEELVADIWSDVLGVDVVGVFDDFFALGGHSLLATQVVARLARTSGREVPLRLLFEAPTVAGMAQRLSGADGTALSPIPHADRAAGLPLSFAQQRLWFLDQFEPGSTEYIAPMAWRLTGELDPAALEAALAAVVARHEVLRTAFPTVEGKPSQHIAAAVAVTLPVLEAGDRSPEQVVTGFVYRPFDLGTGPLWRAAVVRLGPREHVLVLAMHHVVADAWSSGVLVRELSHHYRRGAPGLPPLATQYADFSAWQRNWLTGPVLEAQLGHWRDRLAGLTPLELPADRPRATVRSADGAAIEFTVPAEVAAGLRRLARDHRATLFMVVLAGVQAVLARHSGQHDVAVGTPIAGRTRTEVEDLVGFFVNTLVLRADLSGDPAFTELLERVRTVTLDAYEHQDLPFERLVDELRPERDLARTPLFQVMLTLDNTPPGAWALPGIEVTEFPLGARHAKFDLTFAFTDTPDGLAGVIRYSTALFDAGRVTRLGEHVGRVLEAVARDADRRLSDLPLLTEREHAQVVDEWNPDGGPATGTALLHELVERHAAERPDAVAVTDTDGAVLTYAELNRRANRLAHHLRRRGAGPEQLVGLCLGRSVRTVVSLLAVLKSGAGYLPLDPAYPAERLAFIIEDARTGLVVTDAATATRDWAAEVVNLDDAALTAVLDGLPDTDPRPVMSPQNLAYVIYTSGSTGKPKGVQVTHANATRLFEATRETFGFDDEQVWLSTHSYAFDFSVWEIWGALTTGGRTVIAANAVARDPERLADVIAEQRVTMLSQTPTAFRTLMAPLIAAGPGHLRFVVFGGEALDLTTLRPWFDDDRTRAVALVNMYGITETTVHTTSLVLSPSTRGDAAAGPIGRALSDLRTYVLDADLAPCPIGVPGELYVGGAGVTRGYLGRPGLTAERFVPDPFGTGRLYRTGDVGRWSAEGVLEYLGRTDRQVKIRGFRIELGEIEARLLESADVAAAVVTAREDKPGERRLAGYVVPAGPAPSVSELRAWLERTLPAHQVPGTFVFLPALPLTATGKVDRRALPAPGAARPELASGFAEPRTPAEELLAGVWAQVLGLDRAGVFDNFFDLGGDSILSIQIVARAVAGGLRITPRMVFEHQTIAALAAAAETAPVVRAEQGVVTGDAPLTPIQHWFFARDLPHLDHYNQSMIVTVPPAATERDLRLVLARLAEQHDMLRARFTPGPDGWTQSGTAEIPGDLLWTVRCETGTALTAEADRLQASLDIRAGRVFGALLADLGPRGRRLLLVAHHLVVDGVSWRVLLEDLETGYRQVRAGLPITWPAKTTSFLQWARMLPEYAVSPAADGEIDFWGKRTGPGAVIAVDHPGGANTVESTARVTRELSAELTRALLVEVPAAYRTRINDVLLTALALAIRPYATASDVVIDLEGHGREEIVAGVDLSRTVGWFTSIYPVALDTGGGTGIAEVLKETKQALREIPRGGVGHGILRYLAPGGAGLTDSGGQVLFNYLGQFDNVLAAGRTFGGAEEPRGSAQAPSGRRSHVLELNSEISGGHFRVTVGYSRNLHRAETADRLADAFVAELAAVIAHCTAPGTTGAVPADFPLAGLDQQTLDLIIDEYRRDV